jgi:hypothetical protein
VGVEIAPEPARSGGGWEKLPAVEVGLEGEAGQPLPAAELDGVWRVDVSLAELQALIRLVRRRSGVAARMVRLGWGLS